MADKPQASVDTPIAAYDAMAEQWKLPEALLGGRDALIAGQETWLPRFEGETRTAYEPRLAGSFLFNGFKKAVRGLSAKPFRKPVVLSDDTPERLHEIAEDVDLAGQTLTQFARRMMWTGAAYGLVHVLVDFPRAEPGRTMADERAMQLRPYWVLVRPQSVIGWRSQRINGVETLTQLRIKTTEIEPEGDWGEKTIERVRVYQRTDNGRIVFTLWEKRGNAKEFGQVGEAGELLVDANRGKPLSRIPLVTFYAERTGFMTAAPPLLDLAEKNLEHWQSASDQRNILRIARAPFLFSAGVTDDDLNDNRGQGGNLELGSGRMFMAKSADATMRYVEHTGAAIGAGRQDLRDLEEQMQLLALEPMVRRPGNVTATEKAIDTADEHSQLHAWARGCEETIEQALELTTEWESLTPEQVREIDAKFSTDFGLSLRDREDIQALVQLRVAGDLSRSTLWAELRRRGVLSDDFDETVEQDQLDDEGPALGDIGGDGDAGEGGGAAA